MKKLKKSITSFILAGAISAITAVSSFASVTKDAVFTELYQGALASADGNYQTKLSLPKSELGSWVSEFQLNYLHSCRPSGYYSVQTSGNQVSIGIRGISSLDTVKEQETAFLTRCNELANEVSAKSVEEKVRFFHDYLKNNCSYDYSLSKYSAYDCLVTGSSVCQGYAEAFYNLCKSAGVEVQYVSGTANNGQQVGNHAWNRVKLSDGKWYEIDTCWDSCVGKDTYYLLSAEEMSVDHFPQTYIH